MAGMVTSDIGGDTLRASHHPGGSLIASPSCMTRAVRIAVVGPVDPRLTSDLRTLPLNPEVRSFGSIHAESEAMASFEPDLLVAHLSEQPAEDVGALRLLRNIWGRIGIVLVTDVAGEIDASAVSQRLDARVLVYPDKPGLLAATIEQALLGGDRPRTDVFHDLAHGMADEINNPLLYVSGHLQLLHANLDPNLERDRREQVRAALDGVHRIQETLDRLRLLSTATQGPRRQDEVDLADLVQTALAARIESPDETARVTIAPGAHVVTGDADQLAPALAEMVRFADAMSAAGTATELTLEALAGAARLRVTLRGQALAQWRLPHTFEPFYPSRLLRGHGHGLGLFLTQTVVLGHGGQATSRRTVDGTLQIDFVLVR
ncbi:MAG: HAMP domain-containing histidine kinase [bacterium]|nr:HAMP domain-containing histidine kinase [bacterium]